MTLRFVVSMCAPVCLALGLADHAPGDARPSGGCDPTLKQLGSELPYGYRERQGTPHSYCEGVFKRNTAASAEPVVTLMEYAVGTRAGELGKDVDWDISWPAAGSPDIEIRGWHASPAEQYQLDAVIDDSTARRANRTAQFVWNSRIASELGYQAKDILFRARTKAVDIPRDSVPACAELAASTEVFLPIKTRVVHSGPPASTERGKEGATASPAPASPQQPSTDPPTLRLVFKTSQRLKDARVVAHWEEASPRAAVTIRDSETMEQGRVTSLFADGIPADGSLIRLEITYLERGTRQAVEPIFLLLPGERPKREPRVDQAPKEAIGGSGAPADGSGVRK